jgi:hypothetical protein
MNERSLPLSRAGSNRRRVQWQEGQAIEISRGALTGLTGCLVRRTVGSRWIVRLDGLPHGVVLEIDAMTMRKRCSEPEDICELPAPTQPRRPRRGSLQPRKS